MDKQWMNPITKEVEYYKEEETKPLSLEAKLRMAEAMYESRDADLVKALLESGAKDEKLKVAVGHLDNMLQAKERQCRYDHNRNCQEHSWFGLDGADCPVSQAFDFVEKIKAK